MRRSISPCLILLASAWPAFAKLEIRNVQPAHGPLGPARTSDDVFPLDEYVVRYQISGVKVDKDGKTDLEVAVRLTGPDGSAVVDRKTNIQRPLSLGGDTMQTAGSITFPEKAPPGAYTLAVVIRDKIGSETASFERKLTCKPSEFGILTPRFFTDEKFEAPAGMTQVAGSFLHYRFRVGGFVRGEKNAGLVVRVTVVDADSKDVGAKPVVVSGSVPDAEKGRVAVPTFSGVVVLHRPGDFKLRFALEDPGRKKTATFEVPLKVVAP